MDEQKVEEKPIEEKRFVEVQQIDRDRVIERINIREGWLSDEKMLRVQALSYAITVRPFLLDKEKDNQAQVILDMADAFLDWINK